MKIIQGFLFTASFLLAGSALAGSFPTTWQIANSSDQTIDLACYGKGLGGSRPAEFAKNSIKRGEAFQRAWGDEWYNDGLGLQAATWECKVGVSGGDLTSAGGFSTDWGQNMILTIAQTKSGFIIRSQDKKGEIAKAGTDNGSKTK